MSLATKWSVCRPSRDSTCAGPVRSSWVTLGKSRKATLTDSIPLLGCEQAFGSAEIDADQPADALLHHGHSEQAVHAAHRHRIVGDDQIARRGLAGHPVEQ